MQNESVEHIHDLVHNQKWMSARALKYLNTKTGLGVEQLAIAIPTALFLFLTVADTAQLTANVILVTIPTLVTFVYIEERPNSSIFFVYWTFFGITTSLDSSLEKSVPIYYVVKLILHALLFLKPYNLAQKIVEFLKESQLAPENQEKVFSRDEEKMLEQKRTKSPPPEKPESEKKGVDISNSKERIGSPHGSREGPQSPANESFKRGSKAPTPRIDIPPTPTHPTGSKESTSSAPRVSSKQPSPPKKEDTVQAVTPVVQPSEKKGSKEKITERKEEEKSKVPPLQGPINSNEANEAKEEGAKEKLQNKPGSREGLNAVEKKEEIVKPTTPEVKTAAEKDPITTTVSTESAEKVKRSVGTPSDVKKASAETARSGSAETARSVGSAETAKSIGSKEETGVKSPSFLKSPEVQKKTDPGSRPQTPPSPASVNPMLTDSNYKLRSSASSTDEFSGVETQGHGPRPNINDFVTLPGQALVFNGPFDNSMTYHMDVYNKSKHPIAYAIKCNCIPRITATPPSAIIKPGKKLLVAVKCDPFNIEETKTSHDRISYEYVFCDEKETKFSHKLLQIAPFRRRKNIKIKYNP